MSETEDTPQVFDTTSKYTARVKWFNNRSGYGFATCVGCERTGEDVFVHHSGILVEGEQYKYLVQGEYVEFNLRASDNERHPFQADNIRGIGNGPLMCETHLETKKHRENTRDDRSPSDGVRRKARDHIRSHGSGPREGDQWYLVKRGQNHRSHGRNAEVNKSVDSDSNI
jgi:cold shock CspA family protein